MQEMTMRFCDVTDFDARMVGFESLQKLREHVQWQYPDIGEYDMVVLRYPGGRPAA